MLPPRKPRHNREQEQTDAEVTDNTATSRLDRYRQLRPAPTPEPFTTGSGAHTRARDPLAERAPSPPARTTRRGRFVMQQHQSRTGHFDLRVEAHGVLVSFAIPKGPTLHPQNKRLAIRTEDHPLDYADFEGVIPSGSYGAGAMIVWDFGSIEYLEDAAEPGLIAGKLDFNLHGHKLKGRFALIHTGKRTGDMQHWLWVKKEDPHCLGPDVDVSARWPESAFSGLAVTELGERSLHARRIQDEASKRCSEHRKSNRRTPASWPLKPMLCATRGASLSDTDRAYELKLDGVRLVVCSDAAGVNLRFRHGRTANRLFPEIVEAIERLFLDDLVIDGEVVAYDDSGRPNFQLLARRLHVARTADIEQLVHQIPVHFLVFDLLSIGAADLRSVPLHLRRKLLARCLPKRGTIQPLDFIEGSGAALMNFCRDNALEGVVGKRLTSTYHEGPRRGDDWVKFKCERDAEFCVVGWEESDKPNRTLRSLLVASYQEEQLVLAGKVASGITQLEEAALIERLRPIEVDECVADGEVTKRGKRHHVSPEIVVNVRYLGFSDGGKLRFPVYRGLRPEVLPSECRGNFRRQLQRGERNKPFGATTADSPEVRTSKKATPTGSRSPHLSARAATKRAALTNQNKVFWPRTGGTKGQLCDYYASVASVMLPYLGDRPVVLVRYPDGVDGKHFYQWRAPKNCPSWIRVVSLPHGDGREDRHVFVLDDVDSLLYVANLGCIPIHMLSCRVASRESCDFVTIDFDLGPRTFGDGVKLAFALRELAEPAGLRTFVKTSGQRGLHVFLPLGPGAGFDSAQLLAAGLGQLLVRRFPDRATMDRNVKTRGNRVYIDTVQTGRTRTIAAPYCVRAMPSPQVSMPLAWEHLASARPEDFTIGTALAQDLAGPWRGFFDVRPDLSRVAHWLAARAAQEP